MKWITFPDSSLPVFGMPWFEENAPKLWRLPASASSRLPNAVRGLMRHSSGGRIRFSTDSSKLQLRIDAPNVRVMRNMSPIGCRGFDVYVDGVYWNSDFVQKEGEQTLALFAGAHHKSKQVTIYLPLFQEARVLAAGVDADAEIGPPKPFAKERPVVFYGSSIAQGGCACRAGMTYEAILARRLNVDFVNLGFSGAGKAEPEVVDLVAQLDACCFVFDLGKSFRLQPAEVYGAMLDKVRAAHPSTPLVCVTPIFSTREFYDAKYTEISVHTRNVMRQAATQRIEAGDTNVHLIEGLDLLGSTNADMLHEGVHPTDWGFVQIADRLEPLLRSVLFGLAP